VAHRVRLTVRHIGRAAFPAQHRGLPATGVNTPTRMPALPAAERLPTLDILRGFALMGILIMNMPGFSYSWFAEADGSFHWPGQADKLAEQVRDALFSGKFNSMFSLLFGIGFTIQFTRMQQQDPLHATGLYVRRLLVLLVIGVLHATLFWTGDVLHVYAVLGLLLVFGLRRLSDRGVVVLMALCLLYPLLSGALRFVVFTPEVVALRVQQELALAASNNAAFGAGGFLDAVRENLRMLARDYTDPLSAWGTFGWYVSMAFTMLLGLLAGRRRWVQRIPELMPQIRRLMWWALAVGLGCGAAFSAIFALNRVPGPSLIKLLGSLLYNLSRPAMMIFYVLLIVRLAQLPVWQRRLSLFAAAGRMPLSNYLMQTLICTTLFYNWGFGLWDKVGPAWGFVLSLTIFFGLQVPFSLWWTRRFERGPMEALWARLTYGRGGLGSRLKRPAAAPQ
jgi:uncharacterized protein